MSERTDPEGRTTLSKSDVDSLVIRRVECCSCGWIGTENEQARIDSPSLKELGVHGWDHVCPKCAHDEFYQL